MVCLHSVLAPVNYGMQRVRDWSGPRRIVWLASFPRSGNTWMRALLANLLSTKDKPVSLNRIDDFADLDTAQREVFDNWTGVPCWTPRTECCWNP